MKENMKVRGQWKWYLAWPLLLSLFLMFANVAVLPVSYTHLDVYKRQCLEKAVSETKRHRSVPGCEGSERDVYKRQVSRKPQRKLWNEGYFASAGTRRTK